MNNFAGLKDNFLQGDDYEKYQFFYHPDHLGSSIFITDTEGEVVQHIEYVPYGEVFIEERNNVWNSPYLFNAKEFDEETGLYYYGARYYDPRLAMWYGVDPMAEKGLQVSPYSYCFSNPIVLSDPDGNWPWENRNVRNARRIASEVNGKFQRWEGQNGQTYASVTTTSYGEDGFTITANVCRPTAQNQHNAVWNMLESIDVKEGHSDGANAGYINKQDVKVGFGIMGVLAGGMGALATEFTYASYLGIANSLDDALTNERNESLSQRLLGSDNKNAVTVAKGIISLVSLGSDIIGVVKEGQLINCIDLTNTTAGNIIEQFYPDYYENTK